MHSILLVIKQPDSHFSPKPNMQEEISYREIVTKITELSKSNTNIQLLGDNVLLISIDSTLGPLSQVVSTLGTFPYEYTILSEDLSWHAVV